MFGKKKETPAAASSALGSLKLFTSALDAKGIKYRVDDERPVVRITYDGENYKDLTFTFIFDDDGESVALRVFSIEEFTAAQLPQAYAFCNRMNSEYRWLRFHIDSDNELTAGMDAVITSENAGAVCSELLSRAVDIVDDVCGALRG